MGNSTAKNIVNSSINAMISVATNVVQDCSVDNRQQQNVEVFNCGSVVIQDLSINQALSVDVTCIQRSTANNVIDQQLQEIARQTATAVNNNLNLTGTAEADNITNLTLNLATAIRNSAQQNCATKITTDQSFRVECGNIPTERPTVISGVNNRNAGTIITNCLQTDVTVNNIKQTLYNIIDQTASSTVENSITLIAFVLIGFIIAYILFSRGYTYTAIIVFLVIILLYFIFAYFEGWAPFN